MHRVCVQHPRSTFCTRAIRLFAGFAWLALSTLPLRNALAQGSATHAGLPAFCGQAYGAWSLSDLQRNFDDPKEHDLALFIGVHKTLCDPDAKPEVRQAAERMRAALTTEFGLNGADLRELPAVLARRLNEGPVGLDRSQRYNTSRGEKGEALAAPAMDQGGLIVQAFSYHPQKGFWIADALGDQLSATAQAFLVHTCLEQHFSGTRPSDLVLAACLEDMRSLDRARVFQEADAAPIRPDERLGLKIFTSQLVQRRVAVDKELTARAQKDAAYRALFFDVPSQVKKEWGGLLSSNAELFSMTRALEFGALTGSRKATEGCEAKVAPLLSGHLKALAQPKDPHELPELAETSLGFLVISAAHACARISDGEWESFGTSFGPHLAGGMWLRGPRLATLEALMERAGSLKFDDRAKDLIAELPRDGNRALDAFHSYGNTSTDSAVVEKVEKHGAQVTVSFRAEEVEQFECLNRVKTGRWRYDPATREFGPVMACTKYKSLKVKLPRPEAITLPATQAGGITTGRFLRFVRGKNAAAPLYVWDSPRRSKLVALYGMSL